MNATWRSMFLNGNKLRLSLVLNLSWLLSFSSVSAVAEMPSATLTPHTVYTNDFSVDAGLGWSEDAITTETNGEKFLGANDGHGFGPGSNTLTLNSLPAHTEVTVSFDLYIIESWDGNGDNWQLTADGNNLLSTSFSNCADLTQDYPNQIPLGGDFPARTGAFANGHLGFGTACMGDATYRLSYTFPHTAPNLVLSFTSMQDQESGDEGWGLDNVRVDVKPAGDETFYSTDFSEDVGEEWSSTTGTGTLTQVAAKDGELFLGTDGYASGAGTTTLTLTELPVHSEVAVNADLYIINSWDGNASPDNFQLTADATNLLFTNFAMNPGQTQAYPNQLPTYGAGGAIAPSVGAFEIGHLGEILGEVLTYDTTYRLAYRFAHTEPTLELAFTSMQNEAASNESWGLDNVQVDVLSTATLSVVVTKNGDAGNLGGYVTSNPEGIDCGAIGVGTRADCAEDYPLDTTVILTATAAPGNRFVGWEGGVCTPTSSNTCKVVMTGNKTVTAKFSTASDFVVTAITVPALVIVDVPFTAQVTVKNQGLAAGNAGVLKVWLNSPTVPACRATIALGDKSVTVGTLTVGQSKTFTLTGLTYTTAGNKVMRPFIDADCITLESDDNNNYLLSKVIQPGGPDLIVTTLAPMLSTPIANSQFAARVMVKNQGLGASRAGSILNVWADQLAVPSLACKPIGSAKVTIGALAAGSTTTFIVPGLNAGTPGTKNLRAFVDNDCTVTEANFNVANPEANNQLTKPYRVIGVPDLVITSIVLTPATPAANKEFKVVAIVKNQGPAPSADNFVDVWLNQPAAQTCGAGGDAWASVGSLAPGLSTTVTINGLTAGVAGAKTMRAFVDSWCEIPELNENNNQLTKAYTVR